MNTGCVYPTKPGNKLERTNIKKKVDSSSQSQALLLTNDNSTGIPQWIPVVLFFFFFKPLGEELFGRKQEGQGVNTESFNLCNRLQI